MPGTCSLEAIFPLSLLVLPRWPLRGVDNEQESSGKEPTLLQCQEKPNLPSYSHDFFFP